MNTSILDQLALCGWSLQPESPEQLIENVQAIGIPRLQIALDPPRENPSLWGALPRLCADQGVQLVSGMFTTIGEDYSTPQTIKETGGLVPDATWPANWNNIQATKTLDELNFQGWCCFEREAGAQRVHDLKAGRTFIETLVPRL